MSVSAGRVLIIPRGVFDINAEYHMLDWVRYNNGSYLCKKTSVGILPTDPEYWQLIIDDVSGVFNGTKARWNALSTAEKANYTTVIIIDD